MRINSPWLKKVAGLYDSKRRDFNWRLAADGVIHHHNGLVYDRSSVIRRVIKGGAQAEKIIHDSETALSKLGFKYLGKPKSGAALLDAGCGRGGSSLLLAAKYPGLAIRGVTVSSYQASAARAAARARGLSGRVKFSRASMLELPFGDNSFDLVWACESTEHVPDLGDFFSEMARVAGNRARLVVIAWVRNASHRLGRRYAAQADRAYVTKIHVEKKYLSDGLKSGWELRGKADLTGPTAAYWAARAALNSGSGTESFMAPAFASRALLYRLYVYQLVK
ncbi:MAG: methyltransferase domain-containing protein [Elusimicrobiota bacterium]|nr:methyltransferase domain-containing protein [Elusimicrobiota bacterium]